MSFLAIQAVGKVYGKVEALSDLTLGIEAGSRTAVIGPSGSGKSTLLRLIAGFETPDVGRIMLDGAVLADGSGAVPAYRRGIGIVAQDGALFPHLTIADNIGFGLPRRDPGREARIEALLDMVGLDRALLRRKPDQLSGGQQQRVALARALALRPRLMLLDEPFSALDTGLRVHTRKAVETLLRDAGITTILVTHDQEEALAFADQVAVLSEGRLLQAGSPQDLYRSPANVAVAEFLGEAIVLPADVADGGARCALGRLQVSDRLRRGAAKVMLRPEQIVIAPARDSPHDAAIEPPVLGIVTHVEFAGNVSTMLLHLPAEDEGTGPTIRLRQSLATLPRVGDMITITVKGEAHLFAPEAR